MKSVFSRIRRRWPWFLAGLMVVLAIVGAFSAVAPKKYTAQASDFFTVNSGGGDADMYQGSIFVSSQMASYRSLAVSPVVLDPVIKKLQLDQTAAELAPAITVTSPEETTILTIQATLPDRADSARVANAVAEEVSAQAMALSPVRSTGKHIVSAQVIEKATEPLLPSSPNTANNLIFGTVAALAAGLALALLRDYLDSSIRDSSRLAGTGLPVLGVIPRDRRKGLADEQVGDESARAIALMRDNYLAAPTTDRGSVSVVTSLHDLDGKSTVALALARSLADAGRRTLLVDAGRDGALSQALGAAGAAGLSDLVDGRQASLVKAGPNLALVPRGSSEPVVGSPRLAGLFEGWTADHDVVIVDAVSLKLPGRLHDLAAHANDLLWVVEPGTSTNDLEGIVEARFSPDASHATILNRAEPGDTGQGHMRSRGHGHGLMLATPRRVTKR